MYIPDIFNKYFSNYKVKNISNIKYYSLID